jgi:hypothetical protein
MCSVSAISENGNEPNSPLIEAGKRGKQVCPVNSAFLSDILALRALELCISLFQTCSHRYLYSAQQGVAELWVVCVWLFLNRRSKSTAKKISHVTCWKRVYTCKILVVTPFKQLSEGHKISPHQTT